MANNLGQFLVKLSEEAELQRQFAANPAETMNNFGLSDDEKTLILNRDGKAIAASLSEQHSPATVFVCIAIFPSDPNQIVQP